MADDPWVAALDAIESELAPLPTRRSILARGLPRAAASWTAPTTLGPLPSEHAERAARILHQLDERRDEVRSLARLVGDHRDAVDAAATGERPARFLDTST